MKPRFTVCGIFDAT